MKMLNLILSLLFILFAYFQYNDPDPWLWIVIYLAVAVVCVFAAFGKKNQWINLAILIGLLIYWAILLPSFIGWLRDGMPSITGSMKAESEYIELVREFLGLFILIAVMFWQFTRSRKTSGA